MTHIEKKIKQFVELDAKKKEIESKLKELKNEISRAINPSEPYVIEYNDEYNIKAFWVRRERIEIDKKKLMREYEDVYSKVAVLKPHEFLKIGLVKRNDTKKKEISKLF